MFGSLARATEGKLNYYRRFPGDYLRDTMGLTLLQHGAYTLLLDYLYATERRVADEAQAFSICRAGTQEEQWAVSEILRNFFKKTTTGFTNKRFEREAKLRKDWCKRQKTKRDRLRDIRVTVTPESRLSPSPSPSPSKDLKPKPIRMRSGWPTDLALSEEMRTYAVLKGVADPDGEFEAWRNDCAANHRVYSDWQAAWRTRVYNYPKFHKNGVSNGNNYTNSRARNALAPSQSESARSKGTVL